MTVNLYVEDKGRDIFVYFRLMWRQLRDITEQVPADGISLYIVARGLCYGRVSLSEAERARRWYKVWGRCEREVKLGKFEVGTEVDDEVEVNAEGPVL